MAQHPQNRPSPRSFLDALQRNLSDLNFSRQDRPGYAGGSVRDPGIYLGEGWNNPYDEARRAETMTRAAAADVSDRAAPERQIRQQMGRMIQREGGTITPVNRKQLLGMLTEIGTPPTPDQLLDDPDVDQANALARIRATGEQNRQTDAAQKPGASGPTPYVQERRTRTRQSVDELMGKVDRWTTGVGSLMSGIPETQARNFAAELETLKANIGFNELTEMREASKTGGALGQISNREIALLTSTLGALDTGQSPANMKAQLQKVKDSLDRWEAAQVGGSSGGGGGGGTIRARDPQGTLHEAPAGTVLPAGWTPE